METVRIIIISLLFVVAACRGYDKEHRGHHTDAQESSSVVEFRFVGDNFCGDEQFVFGPVEIYSADAAFSCSTPQQDSPLNDGFLYLVYSADDEPVKNSHLLLDSRTHPPIYRVAVSYSSPDTMLIELHYSYELKNDTMLEFVEGVMRVPFKRHYNSGNNHRENSPPFVVEPGDTIGKNSLLLDLNLLLM